MSQTSLGQTGQSRRILSGAIMALSLALSACGGGGGSNGGATTPTAAPTTQPTAAPTAEPSITLTLEESSPALVGYFPSTAYEGTLGGFTVLQGLSNDNSTSPATSAYLNYSVNVGTDGDYALQVHYAFGGTETNIRDAWVYVNGLRVQVDDDDILEFSYTGASDGKWNTYAYTDPITLPLIAGDNDIRLVAVNTPNYERTITFARSGSGGNEGESGTGTMKGLANIDAIDVSGVAPIIEGSGSTVLYSLSTSVSAGAGNITVTPEQDFYLPDTAITLTADAESNFQFESWTGDAPSPAASYNFNINSNIQLAARFVPTGATQPASLVGFGSVQSDNAIPYTLTGGYGANTTTVTNLNELKSALAVSGPLIIKVSGLIDNSGNPSESLNVPSNTTIFGDTASQGHLKNIELKLSGENYILRNLVMSEVVAVAVKDADGNTLIEDGTGNDIISINQGRHVWIDHCEFYSSLTPTALYDFSGDDETADGKVDEYDAKDFYDGMIDIKNGASFITLSHNHFHDHWKAILIGSSDTQENGDSVTRVTLHHNFFEDINGRIPSLRYGKGHFFNNYVLSNHPTAYGKVLSVDTIFNLRNGAEGLIEGNFIQGAEDTFGYFHSNISSTTGYWNVADNSFSDTDNPVTTSNGDYTVEYSYTAEASNSINTTVPNNAGVGVLNAGDLP